VKHGRGGYLFDARDETSAAHYLEILLHEKAELFPPSVVLAAVAVIRLNGVQHGHLHIHRSCWCVVSRAAVTQA
jgi:hypothetical protein